MNIEHSVVKAETVKGLPVGTGRCGCALFSDEYANGVIGSANTILSTVYVGYWAQYGTHYSQILTSVVFAGFIVGMLSFGYVSDKLGRKAGMMLAFTSLKVPRRN